MRKEYDEETLSMLQEVGTEVEEESHNYPWWEDYEDDNESIEEQVSRLTSVRHTNKILSL